jgi:hypothetical protein
LQAVKLRCKGLQIVPKGIFEETKEDKEQRKVIHKNGIFGHVFDQILLFSAPKRKKRSSFATASLVSPAGFEPTTF